MEVIFHIFEILIFFFRFYWTIGKNVRKQVLLKYAFLILFRVAGLGRTRDGNSDNKANSVQLTVQLQAGTELGKMNLA